MFDYTNNFPIIQPQADAETLQFNAFKKTPEFLSIMQGQGKVIDVNRINDPTAWSPAGAIQDEVTQQEFRNATKVLMAQEGDMRGFMEDIAGYVGLDWFKDEAKARVIRGVYMGQVDTAAPIKYPDSELTPEAIAVKGENLNILVEAEKGMTADPANLTPNQKKIKELTNQILYASSRNKTKEQLGFSVTDFPFQIIDFITNYRGAETADLSDITKIQQRVDPSFNPSTWFDKEYSNPVVKLGLLNAGISADIVATARNEDAAKIAIATKLSKTDLQQRVSKYSPGWGDSLNTFATAMLNDPDLVPGIALEVGVATATGGLSLLATGAARLTSMTNTFVKLNKAYRASRLARGIVYTAETAAKLPLGMAPSYAKKLGILGHLGSTAALGLVGGALTETFRQKSEIAYAAASLQSDPDTETEMNYEAIAWTGLISGVVGGTLFGLAPMLVTSGFGSVANRMKGLNLAPYGETAVRDDFNKKFSLKGTSLGASFEQVSGLFKKEKTIIDIPVDEKIITDAELKNTTPTDEDVVAASAERTARAETRTVDTAEKAATIPEEPASKRYNNESKEQFAVRSGTHKLVTNIVEFARELSRSVPDALDNLELSSRNWSEMTEADKIKVLYDAQTWVAKAREAEASLQGGLTLDRAKVFDIVEKQRKGFIKKLSQSMTKDEYQSLMKSLRGEKVLTIPEALAVIRNSAKSKGERAAAVSELVAHTINKAKEIARNAEKRKEAKNNLPPEIAKIVEEIADEQALTGRVESETLTKIKYELLGEEPPLPTRISKLKQAIIEADILSRVDLNRKRKIKAVVANPTDFVDIVKGNRINAENFYDFLMQLSKYNIINTADLHLLLASTVHLDFNAKAFNLDYKIIVDNTLPFLGRFDPGPKFLPNQKPTLTLNIGHNKSSDLMAKVILHELGHAFFSSNVNGKQYIDILNLYQNVIAEKSVRSFVKSNDPFLAVNFLDRNYYLSNAEETFVETFSNILFLEGKTISGSILSMSATNISYAEAVLNAVLKSVVFAAKVLNTSDYYKSASKIIKEITDLSNQFNDGVGIYNLVVAYNAIVYDHTNFPSLKDTLKHLNSTISTLTGGGFRQRYKLNLEEINLLRTIAPFDPMFVIPFSIAKSEGKPIDYKFLTDAYVAYKKTQTSGLLFRLNDLMANNLDEFLKLKTQQERQLYLQNYYFKSSLEVLPSNNKKNIDRIQPITYEESVLEYYTTRVGKKDDNTTDLNTRGYFNKNALINIRPTFYENSYWLTNGQKFLEALDNLGIDTKDLRKNTYISESILYHLREYLETNLSVIANDFTILSHKQWADSFTQTTNKAATEILNPAFPNEVPPPVLKTKETVLGVIKNMIQEKVDLPTVIASLQGMLNPVLFNKLLLQISSLDLAPEESTQKLLTGVHAMISNDSLSYDPIAQHWGIPKEKKTPVKVPKKTIVETEEAVVKTEKAIVNAAAKNTEVVSVENLESHLTKLMEELVTGKPSNSKSNQLSIIADVFLKGKKSIIFKGVENGSITNSEQLIEAIKRAAKNAVKAELAGNRVDGKRTQQGESVLGDTKEGVLPRDLQPLVTSKADNKQALIDGTKNLLDFHPDLLTSKEKELLALFGDDISDTVVAKRLGVNQSTVNRDFNLIKKKVGDFIIAAEITADELKDPVALKKLIDTYLKKEEVITSVKPTPAKTIVKSEPVIKTEINKEKVNRTLELLARVEKINTKATVSEPTPKSTPEETLYRVTSRVTNNEPEVVLRKEAQADSLIDGEVSAVKEAVVFVPKKPLSVSFANLEELSLSPDKLKTLQSTAPRLGFDALVFTDGSVLPMSKVEPTVVGRLEITKPAGIESVVTVTKEKGVPVTKVSPKILKKPKAAPEGHPVIVTKSGATAIPEVIATESTIVKTSEVERIERVINDDKDMLRANGLDSTSLKEMLSVYWKALTEFDKGDNAPYTARFMEVWNKVIVINKEIMEANLSLFGEEGIFKFWKEVDRLKKIEAVKKVTVPGYKVRSNGSIFKEAGASVDAKFIPFVSPKDLKLKVVDGTVMLSSKDPLVKSIVAENKVESPVPAPPKADPKEPVVAPKDLLPDEEPVPPSVSDILSAAIDNDANNASVPLRHTNLIGAIFGGSNSESANWWRKLMTWMVNTTQTSTKLGLTIRSMNGKIRFISRLFGDERAQTGHLASAGKAVFKTAAQCKSDEKAVIARLSKYQMRINKYLEQFPNERTKLMLLLYKKISEGSTLVDSDLTELGIRSDLIIPILNNSNELIKVVRQVNKVFLDLEAETGLVKTVDSFGNSVEADNFVPVQFNHELLSRLSPDQREILIAKLVEARRNRKLNEKTLDINTLVVLGWLNVLPTAEAKGTALLAGDRSLGTGIGVNTLSKETLDKLRTGITYAEGVDPSDILMRLANKGLPTEYFVLKEGSVLNVYRLPKVLDDLGESDVIRYREAVSGNTELYHPRWKEYLKGKDLIEEEMNQTLDFKTKSGNYSTFNSDTSSNIDKPLMRMGDKGDMALSVPGLIPEEILDYPEIVNVMRTNIAEAYYYFLNGRLFELKFQKELDNLIGHKGITVVQLFDWLYKTTVQDMRAIAKESGWSGAQLAKIELDIQTGISRLREEYAINADTLPYLPNKRLYTARASLALMKVKVAPGYIYSALTEVLTELGKSSLLEMPTNLIKAVRFIVGDLRFKKSAILEDDIGDLPFIMDIFKSEVADRLLGETAHGAFELDSKLRTKFIDSSTPLGGVDTVVRTTETLGKVAESIGSLQAVTNFVRNMALTRWQRRIWKHITKGRIQKLLEVMEQPEMRKLMDDLVLASTNDPSMERKLAKRFIAEARKSGFGFEPQEAMIFFQYGLNSREKITHLEYLINNSGVDSKGRVNINNMINTYHNTVNKPVAGINPKVLEDVLSTYTYMLDDLVIKTSSPEPQGLSRITAIEARSPFGKLWYALTSWIRGYQDSIILNYANKSTLNYVAGTVLMFGLVDTMVGLFREWLAGREHDDILEELTKNPASIAIRVAKSAPIMGSANAIFELFLSGLNEVAGGSWKYYGNPMGAIGVDAAASTTAGMVRGVKDLSSQMYNREFGVPTVKAVGDILPLNSLFNRSPLALPARVIEDMGALDQKGAVQKYLDMIQRDPYPYSKANKKTQVMPTPIATPSTRNIALERQMFKDAESKRIKTQPPVGTTSPSIVNQKGVSESLGNLLENE